MSERIIVGRDALGAPLRDNACRYMAPKIQRPITEAATELWNALTNGGVKK